MDKSLIAKHLGVINKYYPDMNITQLGMVCLYLGIIRTAMGHENAKGTVDNYIHHKHLSKEVRKCLDYIEREILALKRSKIDIDYWKMGNRGKFRRGRNKVQLSGDKV